VSYNATTTMETDMENTLTARALSARALSARALSARALSARALSLRVKDESGITAGKPTFDQVVGAAFAA